MPSPDEGGHIDARPMQPTAGTLGAALERDRLTRGVPVTAVVDVLGRQASKTPQQQPRPSHQYSERAMADFEAEIARINARLRDLTVQEWRA
jgi:hypothetical protein